MSVLHQGFDPAQTQPQWVLSTFLVCSFYWPHTRFHNINIVLIPLLTFPVFPEGTQHSFSNKIKSIYNYNRGLVRQFHSGVSPRSIILLCQKERIIRQEITPTPIKLTLVLLPWAMSPLHLSPNHTTPHHILSTLDFISTMLEQRNFFIVLLEELPLFNLSKLQDLGLIVVLRTPFWGTFFSSYFILGTLPAQEEPWVV